MSISKHKFLGDLKVKDSHTHTPPVQKTWVQSLGEEDPLKKEMATHSSILA